MKVKNIRHLMLGIICLVLAVICLAVGAAGGSAPKYLISAVLLLALGAVNFHGALKGGAEQELLRWTDERDRLVAMRSCQITLQVMNGLLFGGAMDRAALLRHHPQGPVPDSGHHAVCRDPYTVFCDDGRQPLL